MSGVQQIQVTSDEEGMRLDRWFRQHFPQLGQGQLQKLLRKGQIRLDGSRAKTSDRIEEGQTIRVPPLSISDKTQDKSREHAAPKKKVIPDADVKLMQDMVLHRDKHLIVLNKPAGLAVQGGSGTKRHIDGLLPALVAPDAEKPRLVHRLDKDTSGILLVALSAKAARSLTASFRTHEAEKIYWALVAGSPRPAMGKIDLPLSKAMIDSRAGGREQMVVDMEDGKKAVTYYDTYERAGQKLTWVALYPETGRTHQLRVHMAEIGCPIIGDGKYGGDEAVPSGESKISPKLHLHARAIRIPHPAGGVFKIQAPLSAHMKKSWAFLGFQEKDHANLDDWPAFS